MATMQVTPRRVNDISDYGGAVTTSAVNPRVRQLIDAGYSPEQAQSIVASGDVAPSDTAYSDAASYPAASSQGGPLSDYAPYQPGANQFNKDWVNSSEPGKMSEQDRQYAYGSGTDIDYNLQNRANSQASDENYFKQKAMGAYSDLAQTPGYTGQEASDIARKQQWEDLAWKPEDEAKLHLTDDEKNAITGNARAGFDYYDPAFTQEIANNTSANVRGAFNKGQDDLNETLENTNNLQLNAYDKGALKFDPNTGAAIDQTVTEGGKRMRDAADYAKLALDPNFKGKYEMGDQERDALVGRAARQVGTQYRALQDDVELNAAQSGNASPAAVAAMKARLARQSSVDMADARANADLEARNAQRQTYQTAEQMRLGAEQNYAQLASQIESDLIAKGVDAKLAKEQARIQAEQHIAGLNAETAKNVAQQNLDAKTGQQQLQMGMEKDLGAQEQAANLANQNTGTQLATEADKTASDRAKDIAGNRQDVSQYAQNSQFQRGSAINQGVSQGAQTVADARRTDQKEYRGFLTGEQGNASNNVNTANQQRVSNLGVTTNAANNATQNKQQYELGKSGQSFGTAFKKTLGSSLGNAIGGAASNALKP